MLAPNSAPSIDQLTALLNANTAITSWVHALENTVIQPMSPEPSWSASLRSALAVSQNTSSAWLTSTGPQIHATMSQGVIDYANIFLLVAPQMVQQVAAIKATGNTPTAAQQAGLRELANALLQVAMKAAATAATCSAQVAAYNTQMQSDHATLSTALDGAVRTAQADQDIINQIEIQVNALLVEIAKNSTTANSKTVGADTSVFGIVIGLTFGLAMAGGVLAIGGFATAIIGIGVAAVMAEIYSEKVAAEYKQLTALLSEMAQDQVQLVMVQGTLATIKLALESNDEALRTFSSFVDLWSTAVMQIQYMLVVLDQPQIDISKIPDLNDLNAAVASWTSLSAFAQDVQNANFIVPPALAFPVALVQPKLTLVRRSA